MYSKYQQIGRSRIVPLLSLFAWVGTALPVLAQGATRSLPCSYSPDVQFTVSIEVVPPEGTFAYAVEDSPPAGWTQIKTISDGGAYDSQNHLVKWVFFDGVSRTLTYDITPPSDAAGEQCFTGTVSFDGVDQPIEGDQCVSDALLQPCCAPGGTCTDDVLACDCVAGGGTPQGGAICGGMEACCLPDGSCATADALCCDDLGGTAQGEGTSCAEGPGGTCSDGVDNDCDGCTDGADSDCGATETSCENGLDDDCDGLADCADPDCDCIPTVSEWGMIAMALLVLMAGTVVLRRRQPAQA